MHFCGIGTGPGALLAALSDSSIVLIPLGVGGGMRKDGWESVLMR